MILAYSGQALLGIALLMAGLQAFGSVRLFPAYRLAFAQFLLVAVAFGLLTYAHVTDQFSLLSVVLHSHTDKPLLYKISGVWGNHEGSMLLWVLILSAYGLAITRQVRKLEDPYPLAAPLMGFMNFGFLLFVLMGCDPFTLADPIPMQGQDLNPLLQDPSLAIHPPILYLGYAGFSIPFVFSVAALIHGKMPDSWATILRPWILFSWTALTLGVGLGSYWAYYELGWGGWWFWDPVENAALMPWLVAMALVHTVIVIKASKALQATTLFLSILTFALCLFGTFLVRSGLLTSVHNFAVDPERGAFILILSSLIILPALGLFLMRISAIRSKVQTIPLSRSGLILIMTLILLTGTATVVLGTLYPLILEAFGKKITVGAPYFNGTFVPMMLPLLVLAGLGPWHTWPGNGLPPSSVRWLVPIFCLTVLLILVAYLGFGVRHILGLTAFSGAVWTIVATIGLAVKKRKIISGTILSHLGIGIAVLGMVGSSLGEKEVIQAIEIGETFSVGPISLTLERVVPHKGANYTAHQAILVMKEGAILLPEKRFYWTQGVIHGESAIHSVGTARFSHVYVTLGEKYEGGKWSVHAYYKPFINLLWLGMLIVVLGGMVACHKRFRGLPKKVFPLLLLLWHPLLGIDAHEQLTDSSLEERARALSQVILCPTCQGQLVDGSPVDAAVQLRREIRKALQQGQSDGDILSGLIDQYGDQVVIDPAKDPSTYLLWYGPWVVFAIVFAVSIGIIVRRSFLGGERSDPT